MADINEWLSMIDKKYSRIGMEEYPIIRGCIPDAIGKMWDNVMTGQKPMWNDANDIVVIMYPKNIIFSKKVKKNDKA